MHAHISRFPSQVRTWSNCLIRELRKVLKYGQRLFIEEPGTQIKKVSAVDPRVFHHAGGLEI